MANEVALARAGGRGRRSFDIKIIVGGIVILLAVAYLIVSELQEMGAQAQTQQTRVSGNVVPGTIVPLCPRERRTTSR